MKITTKLLIIILTCLLALSPICLATNEQAPTNDNSQSKRVNVINSDLYLGNQDVVVEEAVNGNVFVSGNNVTIKGEVVGDVFILANNLTIDEGAVIYSNIFAFANTITIKGNAYDIYAFSRDFNLEKTGYIYRDAKLYAQNIKLDGTIKKDAYIYAESLLMPDNAKSLIGGNLNYTSDSEFLIPEGAVLGEVKRSESKGSASSAQDIIFSYITKFVCTIAYAIVIILIATFFAPKFIQKVTYVFNKKYIVSAGIGILSFVLLPVISFLFLLTGYLSYISFGIVAVYGLILSTTLAIFSMAISKTIVHKINKDSKGMFILFSILSAIILWILKVLPFVGPYFSLFILVVGLGIFLYSLFMKKDISNEN